MKLLHDQREALENRKTPQDLDVSHRVNLTKCQRSVPDSSPQALFILRFTIPQSSAEGDVELSIRRLESGVEQQTHRFDTKSGTTKLQQ